MCSLRTIKVMICMMVFMCIEGRPVSNAGLLQLKKDWLYGQENENLRFNCLKTARKILGPTAELLKYGDLNKNGAVEALAAVRLRGRNTSIDGTLISRALILRHEGSSWAVVLDISNHVTNSQGFVGIEFIDDSPFYGYALSVADARNNGTKAFTIYLVYLNKVRESEGAPMEISWNVKVGRYQEYAYGDDPPRFKPELKNPPRRKQK